jgi:hypothetical protein
LLKKESFSWTKESTEAFEALKCALSTSPVLQLPDFSKPLLVECDASGSGIGAVLHQGVGAVAFFSRAMAPRHLGLAAYERELICLVQAVRHWRPYLWGREFIVHTDHYSLKFLLDQRLSTIPQHRWVSKLMGFDFSVEYKPGKMNIVADALSRRTADEPEEGSLAALSTPQFDLFAASRQEVIRDSTLSSLRTSIEAGQKSPQWAVVDGLITFDQRIYLPATSPLLPSMITAAHTTGH